MHSFSPQPSIRLTATPSPVEELTSLRRALGGGPRLLIKRDDALTFAFGGNKVRKMQLVAADAQRAGADTLITAGGVQSNHARVTAAAAAKLGMRCILVVNGSPPATLTANALLDRLLGAEICFVKDRADRTPAMAAAAGRARAAGRRPYVIPIGASTPLGAAAFVDAISELRDQVPAAPDVIVHSTSSGGTQAGLLAGCVLHAMSTRVIGISADETASALTGEIRKILSGMPSLLNVAADSLTNVEIRVDDRFIGGGYGVPTDDSRAAMELIARSEAIFLDPTYTAKAMAGLIALVRAGEFRDDQTVLFWHTGGQVALFA
ncbi:MAG TPA: D-cysteine desulfhydrase family protein [Vicinamibacterales bacterium]|jgi:1-aminocyclopropane-1-carboxylate deaminase/D-cysteine desulfhydrase-like pyridoxal-dependent ACC family enzyme|nr:D-cysteine desulfhydrase family protein [Vicinamibacterales bacterium]